MVAPRQSKIWAGEFGTEYTKRNKVSIKEMDERYEKYIGISRTGMYKYFLRGLPRTIKILEVGCNIGHQLGMLEKLGFTNLYGIDINKKSVKMARTETENANIIYGSAFDIPFKNGYFDLVFTSAVIMHFRVPDAKKIMKEVHRCSKKYIMGYEYFAAKRIEKEYRGNKEFLWKDNYAKMYMSTFKNLKIVKEKVFSYIEDPQLQDQMFLLKKTS